jgi:hypothetical protein
MIAVGRKSTIRLNNNANPSMKDLYICRACWLVATPKIITKGSALIEVMLWVLFLIPGIIYSVWRYITKDKVCPACSSLAVSPIDSFMGQKFFEDMSSRRNTTFVRKVLNYQQNDFIRVDQRNHEGQKNQVRDN